MEEGEEGGDEAVAEAHPPDMFFSPHCPLTLVSLGSSARVGFIQ